MIKLSTNWMSNATILSYLHLLWLAYPQYNRIDGVMVSVLTWSADRVKPRLSNWYMLLLRLARSIKEKIIDWLGCVLFFFVVNFTLKGLSVVFFSFVVIIRK